MFQDKEIEQTVLACIIVDIECQDKILELQEEDFTFSDTKKIFYVLKNLYNNKETIDIITVNSGLKKLDPSITEGLNYLSIMTEKIPTTANFSKYFSMLKKQTSLRQLDKILKMGATKDDFDEIIKNIEKVVESTKEIENHQYIIPLADVPVIDYTEQEKVLSGFTEIDLNIGGFYMGEVSVWTGKTGHGKSTFVNQMICEAVDQNFPVCVYSGELVNSQLQNYIGIQFAGSKNVVELIDPQNNKKSYGLRKSEAEYIKELHREKLYIYDNEFVMKSVHHASIVDIFKQAYKQYGCKVFVLDNLMSARFINSSSEDYYTQQSCFVGELVSFAKSNNVHVHIIAHPKKTLNDDLENEDIAGTMDIANRADNVFSISRTNKEKHPEIEADGKFIIRKNRSFGVYNVRI